MKHFSQQIHSLLVHTGILCPLQPERAASVFVQHLIVSLTLEHTLSRQQKMKDQTQTENVTNRFVLNFHILYVDHLRSHITRSPAPHIQIILRTTVFRQSKIRYDALNRVLTPQQNVLRLEITMHNSFSMDLLKSSQNAADNSLHLLGLKLLFSLHRKKSTLIF